MKKYLPYSLTKWSFILFLYLAYASYSIAWQEYKRMGQLHNEYIDRDTISGIQFG
jgi:hypothetical protein